MFNPCNTKLSQEQHSVVVATLKDLSFNLEFFKSRNDYNEIVTSRDLTSTAASTLKADIETINNFSFPYKAWSSQMDSDLLISIRDDPELWNNIIDHMNSLDIFGFKIAVLNTIGYEDLRAATTQAVIRNNVDLYNQMINLGFETTIFDYFAAILSYAPDSFKNLLKDPLEGSMFDDDSLRSELFSTCLVADNAECLIILIDNDPKKNLIYFDARLVKPVIDSNAKNCAKGIITVIMTLLNTNAINIAGMLKNTGLSDLYSDSDSDNTSDSGSESEVEHEGENFSSFISDTKEQISLSTTGRAANIVRNWLKESSGRDFKSLHETILNMFMDLDVESEVDTF